MGMGIALATGKLQRQGAGDRVRDGAARRVRTRVRARRGTHREVQTSSEGPRAPPRGSWRPTRSSGVGQPALDNALTRGHPRECYFWVRVQWAE